MLPILYSFKKKYDLRKLMITADSGLLSASDISALQEKCYEFVLGAQIINKCSNIKEQILSLNLTNGESAIIEILGMSKFMQIQKIHVILKEQYSIDISLAQMYKTINKLLDAQILVKQGKEVSLNLRWIEKIRSFMNRVEKNYISSVDDFTFDIGNTQLFHADSLFALDTMRNHAVQKMITLSP